MKLLFDQNLSSNLVKGLADIFSDSQHVHPLGLGIALDTDVWQVARAERYTIVTKDADFSDLCLLLGFPPNVVWIRRGNCKTSAVEALLRLHAKDIEQLESDTQVGILALF